LGGARQQATFYEGDRQETHTHKPYQFGGKNIYTARELAAALSEDWEGGVKNFGRGFVSGWVEKELSNQDLASRLMDLHEDKALSPEEKLALALCEMDPELPGVWKGNVVNREWAAQAPARFKELLGSKAREKLARKKGWPVEVVSALEKLGKAGLPADQQAALEQMVITGSPELKMGDWAVTPESLAKEPEKALALLKSKVPQVYEELTQRTWLSEAAARWQRSVAIEAEHRSWLWHWACTGEAQLINTKGEILDTSNLPPALLEGNLPVLWQEMSDDPWLAQAAADWREYWPRVEALGCGTSKEKALPWIIGPREQLTARATELLGRYIGSKKQPVQALWEQSEWGTSQCVALCAADEAQLLTDQDQQLLAEQQQQADARNLRMCWAAVLVPVGASVVVAVVVAVSLLIFQWQKAAEKPAAQIAEGGTVVAWGAGTVNTGKDPHFGQTTVPVAARSGVTAIAAGERHSVALKSDGTVVAWGANNYGQTNVPVAAQSGVTAIAGGPWHTAALKSNGTVVAWGNNEFGQTTVPVAAQSRVTAIAVGGGHTVALKSDGTVVAWGWNIFGQTNVPENLSGVTAIAAGDAHTVALKLD
jgi:hypothetical protein